MISRVRPKLLFLLICAFYPFLWSPLTVYAKKTLRVTLMRFLENTKGPLIVVADLNDVPGGSAYKLMRTKFDDAWIKSRAKGDGFSYPADKPVKRIDHIFYRRGDQVRPKKAWVVTTLASDHVPVVAELEVY